MLDPDLQIGPGSRAGWVVNGTLRYRIGSFDMSGVLHAQTWKRGDALCGVPFALLDAARMESKKVDRAPRCIACAYVVLLAAPRLETDVDNHMHWADFFDVISRTP